MSTGIAEKVFDPSIFKFYGLTTNGPVVSLPPKFKHKIEFIGASDTAGYCVDGTPKMSAFEYIRNGWKYENCDQSNTGNLGRMLDAEISVQGITGIGLTQNAAAREKWELGKLTMNDYYNRTLQSEEAVYNFTNATAPELVVISLGGNDFNHQNGSEPSNSTFT